jgi:cytochrome c oxidase cbb3-type subunit 1
MLHLGNNLDRAGVDLLAQELIVWSGVQDAMFQWWYGHNAVGFFLTAGFLAIMYYFVPKRRTVRSIPTGCRSSTSGR